MPIQIACPTCSRQLRVPDNLIGQMVKCPSCQNTFVASVEEGPPPQREESYQEEERIVRREPREDRPSRRRHDDDYDDDRPSRRRYEPHRGTLILILGILSLTGLGMITGIPAWIMGNADMEKIRNGTMDPTGESSTNIGRILGMVSTILGLVGLVFGGFCCCLSGLAPALGN